MCYENVLKRFRLNSFQFMVLGDKSCHEHILKAKLICVQPYDNVTL